MTVVTVSTTGVAYLRIRQGLEDALQVSLDQAAAGFATARTTAELEQQVRAAALVADAEKRIVAFLPVNGQAVGNATARMVDGSPELRAMTEDHNLSDHDYDLRVIVDARGTLILGQSRDGIDELGEVFFGLITSSLVPTVILSLAAALIIAMRSGKRVVRIEETLVRLTKGDMHARVNENPRRRDDLARIGNKLDRMALAQEQSVAALKQVSADIAHDLKTPVQRIAVLMEGLRGRVAEGSPESDLVEQAVSEADRAVGVFQSLLQIAQIEGGSPKGRFRKVDLSAVVATFADIYGPAAEDSGHILTFDRQGSGPIFVRGDKDLLGQVVANLIENGLRHTPVGATIRLSLEDDGQLVIFSVADNGPGVPEAEREFVLRRLYRLERSRTSPGNGLGLALVAAIADLHDAALVLSDNAPGLVVTLTFDSC
ncbi:MAG TPA: HAMP domain-containing sensor histidine kinase [Albidovulum sp.]|uniref:sensor histidine kinase n=1 Tax=Albidovulum sp. TaxID=1872424 RepID=UPI002BF4CF71|nr:HAMP domain-containing sensor histidine kinase [Albidovulum sp.]